MTRPIGRFLAALSLVLVGAAALFGLAATPAGAHEGPGILVMESDTPTGTSHRYVIRLTWENDGHPAARTTTINLTPVAPDGAARTPVPMTPVDDDGRFEATVDLATPGAWKVRFTALNPSANVEVDVDVAAPATTTTAPSTTTEAPSTTAPEDDGVDTEAAADRDDPGSDSTSGGGGPIVVAVLVVVAVAAAGALAVAYRSKRGDGTGSGGIDPGPDPDL